MDDPHYACAPLAQWLPGLAGMHERVLSCERALPRRLRHLLGDWPRASSGADGLGLVVVVGEVDASQVGGLVESLRAGGWLVELCATPRNLTRAVLALPESARQRILIGQRAVRRWTGSGLFDLQQRISTDPPDLLVTCGRRHG